jgi:hypothetical protein
MIACRYCGWTPDKMAWSPSWAGPDLPWLRLAAHIKADHPKEAQQRQARMSRRKRQSPTV